MKVAQWGQDVASLAGLTLHDEEQAQLLGLSEFLAQMARRDSEEFQRWLDEKRYLHPATSADIVAATEELATLFPAERAERTELPQFQRALRKLRNRIQRKAIWRHLSRRASHAETVAVLSTLADSLLRLCLAWSEALVAGVEGEPLDDNGKPQHLVIFALGKLGGRELNLSSDVDLVCAYPESGSTSITNLTNQQFFVQVVQLLLKLLSEYTGDGFGFRIDLRLRPYGDSGPIVQPFAAIERYYETSGRDWERYAWIKARACAGSISAGALLLNRLRPFVYRRYLDFAAIDSMREMRALIRRDHKTHADNVKLCAGGIRDVEFLAQMLQLVWGGRVEVLRTNSLAVALDGLVLENLLSTSERTLLWESYEFSRDVEHCLQAFRDEQTHSLPGASEDQLRLAVALGFPDYAALELALRESQGRVVDCLSRWLDIDEDPPSVTDTTGELLAEGSIREAIPGRATQVIDDLRAAAARSPEIAVVERLERLIPLLLEDVLEETRNPEDPQLDEVLLRLAPLISNVLRRSAYLVLLSENEDVRQELVSIARGGDYFTGLLSKHPALLEELFLRINLAAVPELDELRTELLVLLPESVAQDLQQQHFDQLAQYKSQHQFRCLLALSRGDLKVTQVADYLTRLAQSVIEVVLRWAWTTLANDDRSVNVLDHFLVVGYGKLGGFELGAGSDLDLVFLHDEELARQPVFHQLVRRLLNYLMMQTYFGSLYDVDIRLRPAGRDGTMVSTLTGFAQYQGDRAWLWEHQALLRARPVAGSERLAAEFELVRRKVLGRERDRTSTREQIVLMREKMRASIVAKTNALRLKQGPGGIVDIEFMVQYLALGWSAQFPSLLDFTDNTQIVQQAVNEGLLGENVAKQLIADYAQLRHAGQMLIVSPDLGLTQADVFVQQQRVASLWQQLMIDGVAPQVLSL